MKENNDRPAVPAGSPKPAGYYRQWLRHSRVRGGATEVRGCMRFTSRLPDGKFLIRIWIRKVCWILIRKFSVWCSNVNPDWFPCRSRSRSESSGLMTKTCKADRKSSRATAVLWIRYILLRIRICGPAPPTDGSSFGSCYVHQRSSKRQPKIIFSQVFFLCTF